jgi:ABC-2 type transport system permease protein
MHSPIADLSYRNYDGPLEPPLYRWWPIARTSMLRAFKNKWFWILSVLSGAWYMILMIIFYFIDSFALQTVQQRGVSGVVDPAQASAMLFRQVKWNDMFLHAFSIGQMFFLFIALLIGIGSIANDNRANALLVYLSKPCTRLDYIIGKWLGIFIPMVIAVSIPTFFFFSYCFMSYRSLGFLSDHWLFLRLAVLVLVPAFVHASLALGISSLFKRGGLAGATYAGLYYITLFFTNAMSAVRIGFDGPTGQRGPGMIDNLFYFSVDGIQIAAAKNILGTNGGSIFPFLNPRQMGQVEQFTVPSPNGLLVAVLLFGICGLSILIAWSRVRAVEVVS